jgi:hypothetical protein
MKRMKTLAAGLLIAGFLAGSGSTFAADTKVETKAVKPKPYPLKTCVVSDESLGDMGEPYVFIYKGREIKMCCKSCRKDFDKDPAKYVKKLEAAEKKAAADKTK